MLESVQSLSEQPQFYNTLLRNCTTEIVSHVNKFRNEPLPWSYRFLLPSFSDEYTYQSGLLDQTLPFDELRQQALINSRAETFADDPGFSQKIREW